MEREGAAGQKLLGSLTMHECVGDYYLLRGCLDSCFLQNRLPNMELSKLMFSSVKLL